MHNSVSFVASQSSLYGYELIERPIQKYTYAVRILFCGATKSESVSDVMLQFGLIFLAPVRNCKSEFIVLETFLRRRTVTRCVCFCCHQLIIAIVNVFCAS